MQTLCALDLTKILEADDLWRLRRSSAKHPAAIPSGLPLDGFSSPLGFWFATAESWGSVVAPLRLEVFHCGEQDGQGHAVDDSSGGTYPESRYRQARIRLKSDPTRSDGSGVGLIVEISPTMARIGISADSWSSVSETVLIVVAQYWRFAAIDRLLDELTDWARRDLQRPKFTYLIGRRRLHELYARRREFHRLLLDLPDFEIFLTDPCSYLTLGHPSRLHRALAAKLSLHRRRRALDERIEVVEAVLDSLADSLHHHQSLTFQLIFELAIVVLLLLDVGLFLWDFLGR